MSADTSHHRHPFIAKEGWLFIIASVVIALVIHYHIGFEIAIPFWLLAAFVVQFFRDPKREAAGADKTVVAPADGRIIVIEHAYDPYLQREAVKVSIFMNVFNVHSQRSPVDGTVKARWYYPGKFFNAAIDKASHENERNALHITTDDGQEVTCVQVAGLIARRIRCYVEPGAHLVRGERYGFIRFGSRLDVYLPETVRIKVVIGQKVAAATTILAELA